MHRVEYNTDSWQVAISPQQRNDLLNEIQQNISQATVWVFGSRVNGTHRRTSDMDLAVLCDKKTARKDLPRLNEALVESDLPFKVQILDYNRLPENMQAAINEKYVVLYQPKEATTDRSERTWEK